jgi:hypothetical protein
VVAAESLFFALAKKRNLSLCYLFVLCVSVVNFFLPRKWEYAHAYFMIKDAIKELMHSYFKDEFLEELKIRVSSDGKETIVVTSNDTKLFLALALRRQREKSGSTIKEAAGRLGSKSPNAYAQYEKGFTNITVEKYEELLEAANPTGGLRLRLA